MKNSAIEWTHHTFNPWIGCTKVSPGCKNCYAAALDNRWGHDRWGVGKPRERTSAAYWRQPIAWNLAARKAGERHRVFCASLADVFDDVPEVEPWRRDLFGLISATPHLDWLLLTKRPENIERLWPGIYHPGGQGIFQDCPPPGTKWPNVWLGTTVEDQDRAEERIHKLRAIPAIVHFLSVEPLIARVMLDLGGIEWVIAGGESGPSSRPMKPEWVQFVRDQCEESGVPFLFKQWGEFDADGKRVGKKASGRKLDGVQHDGYPTRVREHPGSAP